MYETHEQAHEAYRDFLREAFGVGDGLVKVAGYEYDVARVFSQVDPTAYRCGYLEWLDGEGVDSDDLAGEDHSDPREPDFYASN